MDGNKIHGLLNPQNCAVLLIDYEPQMAFGVKNIDGETLVNNTVGLAKAARVFNLPTVITTVAAKTFSGPIFERLHEVFPDAELIDRTSINAWEDKNFKAAVERTGRKKLVFGGLWTELCIAMPVISAMEEGYEAYVVGDACGDVSTMAHEMAMTRMIQAGAVPMNWLQVLLELQRDWARKETYDAVLEVVREHAGTYGLGVEYANAVMGTQGGTAMQ